MDFAFDVNYPEISESDLFTVGSGIKELYLKIMFSS